MPNNAQLETFTAGVETIVDVAQIERQLHELWQLAAESEKDPSQRQITRACLFNFIVYCETDEESAHASEVISTLTSHHPCRRLLLAKPDVALANCRLQSPPLPPCRPDRSRFAASRSPFTPASGVAHLGAAVLPLLESDLPTVIWWQGDFLKRIDLSVASWPWRTG